MAGFLHLFGVFCLLGATVLLIIVSVGLPIWDAIYFLRVDLGQGRILKMGQWGICIAEECSRRRLGYNVDFLQTADNGNNGRITPAIVHGLTYALVLNPIAAGFSLIALFMALGTHFILGLIGSIFAFFAFIVTLVALALDLALFVTAHHRLGNAGVESSYEKALWMVVAAAAAQLIAAFTVCCTRSRHNDRETAYDNTNEKRGFFGRRRAAPATTTDTYGNGTYGNDVAMSQPKRHFWQRNKAPATATY